MRISTQSTYENTIQNMDNQQSMLARLEQQASTGIRVATPSDDPLGAAQAVQLSAEGSALAQFASNQNTATSLLQTEDSTLSSVTTTLQDILTQLNPLGAGDVSDSNRQAAAKALTGTPADGDSFTVTPAAQGNTDVFQTIDWVIAALQNPAQNNPVPMATIGNAISTAQTEIDNTMTNVTTVQADVAGRKQQVTALGTSNSRQACKTRRTSRTTRRPTRPRSSAS
jgi:flagellar hook-associated protein 3 FlgL